MRDYELTEFKKMIRISEEQALFIKKIKGKKSKAGKLKEIIEYYKNNVYDKNV